MRNLHCLEKASQHQAFTQNECCLRKLERLCFRMIRFRNIRRRCCNLVKIPFCFNMTDQIFGRQKLVRNRRQFQLIVRHRMKKLDTICFQNLRNLAALALDHNCSNTQLEQLIQQSRPYQELKKLKIRTASIYSWAKNEASMVNNALCQRIRISCKHSL